ncbi:MAG: pyridoxal phosphate-dependent aminotransferase, partial [Woeseiaceae bacterium]
RWCRQVYGAVTDQPEARLLSDSTICEPTERLFQVLRSHSAGAIADRYESVFSHGNRFVARAIAARYGIDEDQILCTTGATNAVAMVLRTRLAGGGHVVVESPCFDLLPYIAREAGASISMLPRRDDFRFDPDELASRLQRDTRAVLITNLHNPSGEALGAEALVTLASEAAKVGATLVVDEVYTDFARELYGGCAAKLAPNIISVNSLSKVHGLFALRCGWVVARKEIVDSVYEANAQDEFGVSKLTHAVASFLLEDEQELDLHWRSVLSVNRPTLQSYADQLTAAGLIEGAVPEYGCMYFPKVCGIDETWALARWLWHAHRLLVAPGEFFGAPGRIRLGFGGSAAELSEGLSRFAAALEQYRKTVAA